MQKNLGCRFFGNNGHLLLLVQVSFICLLVEKWIILLLLWVQALLSLQCSFFFLMADLSFYTFSIGLGLELIADESETDYLFLFRHSLVLLNVQWVVVQLKKPKHLRHWHRVTRWALSALVILWFYLSFDAFSISSTRCNKIAPQHDGASTRFYYKWAFSLPSSLHFIAYKQTDALYSQRAPLWL